MRLCLGISDNWQIKSERRSIFVAADQQVTVVDFYNFFCDGEAKAVAVHAAVCARRVNTVKAVKDFW